MPSKAIGSIKPASGTHANAFYGVGGAAVTAGGAATDDSTNSSDDNLKSIEVLSLLLKPIAHATMTLLCMYLL